ncbi:MAG: hypothetical protein O3A51_07385 [Verrucomicrobia bacterium]|nr:hypothetical protein [Verrucomicrobiota bacterium]
MTVINRIMNRLFDLLLSPFDSPWAAMITVSLLTAILLLLIFKFTSNPEKIRRRRNRAIARVLEIAVYRDAPSAVWRSLAGVIRENLRYMAAFGVPLCVSLIPLMLITVQVHEWFAARPLHPGESTTLTVRLADTANSKDFLVQLDGANSVTIESPGIRAHAQNEISWRIRAVSAPGNIDVLTPQNHLRKQIPIGTPLARSSQSRRQQNLLNQLLAPSEPAIETNGDIDSITLRLPQPQLSIGSYPCHWLVAFFGLSFASALLLHKPMRVEI